MLRHGCVCVFFFKQKTSYEMRISDWISDVCSSDLYGINLTLNVNWERLAGSMIAGYRTEYRINGAEWVPISSRTSLTSIEIVNPQFGHWEIGRASCRARGCQYVSISVVAGAFNNKSYTRSYRNMTIITLQYH